MKFKIPTSNQVFEKIENEQIKQRYKTWMQLSIILFTALTVTGKLINIPYVRLDTMFLWSVSYILVIIIGIYSTFKFLKANKKLKNSMKKV